MSVQRFALDEMSPLRPEMWDYLTARSDRARWEKTRPLPLETFFRLRAADAARRLDVFEQQLQRRRILQEHEAAVLARRVANWDAVERASPYRSKEVH